MAEKSGASAKAGPGVLLSGEPGSYTRKPLNKECSGLADEPDLFGNTAESEYPNAPGHRGVETSIAAAEDIAHKLGRLQKLALDAITARYAFGLTADELAEALECDRYSIQPRTSELRRKGLIIDSGKRRRNSSGKAAIVWVAAKFAPEPGQ